MLAEENFVVIKELKGKEPLDPIIVEDSEASVSEEENEDYLSLSEILQSQKVTQNLCDYLDIRDSSIIINLFTNNFSYILEEKLFYVFIKIWNCSEIKIKNDAKTTAPEINLIDEEEPTFLKNDLCEFLNSLTVVNFFDRLNSLTECSYEKLLNIYMKGYEMFQPFFIKLDSTKKLTSIAEFFDNQRESVIENTLLILNLNEFLNSMVVYEYENNNKRIEKLSFIREMLVNDSLNHLHNIADLKNRKPYILSLLHLNEKLLLMDYYRSLNDFQSEVLKDSGEENLFEKDENEHYFVREDEFDKFLTKILNFFNEKVKQADSLFGTDYLMVVINYMEEIIGDDLLSYFNLIFSNIKYFQFFGYFYTQLFEKVISKIEGEGTNCYGKTVLLKNTYGFIKLYFGNLIQDYLNLQVTTANQQIREKLLKFEQDNVENLNKENELFYNQKIDEIKKKKEDELNNSNTKKNKSNFLRSFQHMLKIGTTNEEKDFDEELEIEFNLKKLENDIGNIKNLIDLPLCMDVIQIANKRISNITSFLQTYSKLGVEITSEEMSNHEKHCENVYSILLKDIDLLHLSKAFEKSLKLLNEYDIDVEIEDGSIINPLMNFSELVNVSDIILQLLQIFYKNEIENFSKKVNSNISKKKSFDFLNQLTILKKNFEIKVDDFVANGLNAGITKLMQQIEYIYELNQSPKDYCPDEINEEKKATSCCLKTIHILKIHCQMISQSLANKATLEIYNQEITERLFQLLVKNLKKNIVNVEGGENLIIDLRHYKQFIEKELKMKKLGILFTSLINVGELFTIDYAQEVDIDNDLKNEKLRERKKFNRNKAIGKDIAKKLCDSGMYHGVFTQDEAYDMITRRIDWYNIKPFVDKSVYGLDCCII
ncbi:hypothetical protein QEN19_002877 [Hanseniaspora menglaensis]